MRARVASLATALAPFSQNSAVLRSSSGSGQAQLGQSKPSFWLSVSSVFRLRVTPMSRAPRRTVSQIDVRPARAAIAPLCLGALILRRRLRARDTPGQVRVLDGGLRVRLIGRAVLVLRMVGHADSQAAR